jgi:hypothetical protein
MENLNMSQNASIQAAIAAASQVAAAIPMAGQPSQAVAVAPAPLGAGRVRGFDDAVNSAGAAVDLWLSVDSDGYKVGSTKVAAIAGTIDMGSIKFPYMCRANVGGGTKFVRSYDGVREAQSGRPWAEVCAQLQALDANCKGQYDAAEIPLVLDADLVAGEKVIKAGRAVGITTPVTGFKPFMAWARQFASTDVVSVIASVETNSKKGVRDWGIPTFAEINAA